MKSRTRLLRPQAMVDADLWDLGEQSGLPIFQGFLGLLCWADREGRFEWKPRELKVGILPYWQGDYGAVLDALEAGRFVTRYEVDGKVYGHVRTFAKHQSVNHREEQSKLPPPPGHEPRQRMRLAGEAGQEEARRVAMPMDAPEEDDEAAMERITREAFSVYKGGR